MPVKLLPRAPFVALFMLLAVAHPGIVKAQIPAVLNPGDRYVFSGADVDADQSGCDGTINSCSVDYGDLGADSPRMYVASAVAVGVAGTTRQATGRLVSLFSVSEGPEHLIGAKLIGFVRWRGWLIADLGAFDNSSSSLIGVSLYDVTDPSKRVLVANQMVHTNSVGGQISVVPTYSRDIGQGGFDLAVNLERGHSYMAAVEATCASTSGAVGFATAASYSNLSGGMVPLADGYVQRLSMAITLDPDYLALIDELREEFENHTHNYLTGRGVGQNNTQAVTSGPVDAPAPSQVATTDPPSDAAGAPELTLVTAAPDRVELRAQPTSGRDALVVERRTGDTEWTALGAVPSSGTLVDAAVAAGTRYGYRLRVGADGGGETSAELWVDVPSRLALGLERSGPNPVAGNLQVVFTLPASAPATMTLFDVQGRVVSTRDVGAMGVGRHVLEWSSGSRLPSGIYLLRLTQSGRSVTSKVAVLR